MVRSIKIFLLSVSLFMGLFVFHDVHAQSEQISNIDYKIQTVEVSNSGGLKNEVQSDNQLDVSLKGDSSSKIQTPWAWYISRMSGLIGFILLYISMFLVLTIRIPFLRKIFKPVYALNAHGWIALQATIFAFLHGVILSLDKYLGFSLANIFIPFTSDYEPIFVGLGTIVFYLMVILVATSYFRKHMKFKIWRLIHYLNIFLYFSVIIHAINLGTDMKNEIIKNTFICANIVLILLMLTNMFLKIRVKMVNKVK